MSKKPTETVKVMVRMRPMNSKELGKGCQQIVHINRSYGEVSLAKNDGKEDPRKFTFDTVYGDDSIQQDVYDECAFPLVDSVIGGYNGTMFAYGQTGCGKTHTMMGPSHEKGPEFVSDDDRGIIPKAIRHIFNYIDSSDKNTKFLVRCSYLEIYNEKVLDLLGKTQEPLQIKEDPNKGTYVKDLTTVITKNIMDTEKAMNYGLKNRKTGATAMNADSSRSHSIFTIYIETAVDQDKEGKPQKAKIKAGKLNLVDLAGSERQSKTQATGARLDEAKNINLSLSALGNVIKALVDGVSTHIPYRDSKLTRLLQDSLGGNTKTVMIAALSPADYNYEETLSTLRYADRAKQIKNKPRINEDPKDALLREYQQEIQQLKEMLQSMQQQGASSQQMNEAVVAMQSSIKAQKAIHSVEDNVDTLLKKIEGQGKKVKILSEEEEAEEQRKREEEQAAFQQKLQDLAKVEQEKLQLDQDKQNIENELQVKEERLLLEQQEKEKLEALLGEMNQAVVTGSEKLEQKEKEQAEAFKKYQDKITAQRKEAKKLKQEQQRQEEELMSKEQQFANAQDELEASRQIIKKLKQKYDQANRDLKDLEREQQGEKDDLLISLRQNEVDLKFYEHIIGMVLKPQELQKIKMKATYDDDDGQWNIPVFALKAKEVSLPTLSSKKQAQDYMENQKENRQLDFADEGASDGSQQSNDNGPQSSYLQQYEAASAQNRSANAKRREDPNAIAANGMNEFLETSGGKPSNGKMNGNPQVQVISQVRPKEQSNSNTRFNNQSQSVNQQVAQASPDLMTKNTKAMAQLAPLNFSPALQNPTIAQNAKGSQGNLANMPSLEQLQTYNKLQPLKNAPKPKGKRF